MGIAELCVDERIGDARILFGLMHDPAIVADLLQRLGHGCEVDDSVSGGGEDSAKHSLGEAEVPPKRLQEGAAPNVLDVDVGDPLRMPANHLHRVAACE